MENKPAWHRRPQSWVELFALFNLAGLAPDIYLAHSTNFFHRPSEYIPLGYSLVAPLLLLAALWALVRERLFLWQLLGQLVGWTSIALGIAGLVLHLESQFFRQWTLASLVYAAPFAAPLAYTGIGFLLVMNRMVDPRSRAWAMWVIFLALGGFVGNFIFSVTDHAQNGFFHKSEWIPVISSGLAVGFLLVPFMMRVDRGFLLACAIVMAIQAAVGILGFGLHAWADWHGTGLTLMDRVVYGAPIFAPMLFPDLVILAGIGLWTFAQHLDAPDPRFPLGLAETPP